MVTLRELQTEELYGPGHRLCAGCGGSITARMVLKAMKRPVFVVNATGCLEVATTIYPYTAWRVPWVHGLFENAPAIATGLETMLKSKNNGKLDADIIIFGGDGGTFDIGLQALSGAFERRHDFVYICYDNEAYENCLPGDTPVFTAGGLKRVDEVKLGESIYALDMKTQALVLRTCSGLFDNGVQDVYEVTTLHHNLRATSNHPFLVVKGNGRGKNRTFIWKTQTELIKGDKVIVLKKLDGSKSFHFVSNFHISHFGDYKVNKINKVTLPKHSTPELMEYLGLYVGDGWDRTGKAEVGFAVPKGDRARRTLLKLHKTIFGQNEKGVSSNANEVHFYSINLARFINSLGFGNGAKNKTLPGWVFTLPREEKEALVRGLMLSDGYITERSYRYPSASFELLRRLRLLLQTMDYRVGKIHWFAVKKGRQFPHMKMLKDTAFGYVCFSTKRRWNVKKYPNQYRYQNPLVANNNFSTEAVRHVRYVGRIQTFDLRVEDEHNFIAAGVVVHNTGIQRSSATPEGAWTTTTPVGAASQGKVGPKKDLMAFALSHYIDYAATASTAYWSDFITKVRKAAEVEGPALIHVISPCPLGWKFKTDQTIQMGRLAVQTRYFPLYEVEKGKYRMSVNPQPHPLDDFLKAQGRFSHLFRPEGAGELELLRGQVERKWAALQELCQGKHPSWLPSEGG